MKHLYIRDQNDVGVNHTALNNEKTHATKSAMKSLVLTNVKTIKRGKQQPDLWTINEHKNMIYSNKGQSLNYRLLTYYRHKYNFARLN